MLHVARRTGEKGGERESVGLGLGLGLYTYEKELIYKYEKE